MAGNYSWILWLRAVPRCFLSTVNTLQCSSLCPLTLGTGLLAELLVRTTITPREIVSVREPDTRPPVRTAPRVLPGRADLLEDVKAADAAHADEGT